VACELLTEERELEREEEAELPAKTVEKGELE
jgi:hypothetical protein